MRVWMAEGFQWNIMSLSNGKKMSIVQHISWILKWFLPRRWWRAVCSLKATSVLWWSNKKKKGEFPSFSRERHPLGAETNTVGPRDRQIHGREEQASLRMPRRGSPRNYYPCKNGIYCLLIILWSHQETLTEIVLGTVHTPSKPLPQRAFHINSQDTQRKDYYPHLTNEDSEALRWSDLLKVTLGVCCRAGNWPQISWILVWCPDHSTPCHSFSYNSPPAVSKVEV